MNKGSLYCIHHGKYIGHSMLYMRDDKGFKLFLLFNKDGSPFGVMYIKEADFNICLSGSNVRVDRLTPSPWVQFADMMPENVVEALEPVFNKFMEERTNIVCDILCGK